ncbi:MAG: 16S rRNA (guanine966-N2)-methyltransferase [Hydrogenophaga sp.]|jgi:16S rRNA (guanine966-N2)-methyltransferase
MKPSTSQPSKPSAPQEVRIIGGRWKRTPLPVLDRPGLRPTPARVRETLFNWLGHDLTGWRCVDAFAGTGALGLEAASRGAAEVVLIEQDAALVTRLNQLKARLQGAETVRVERGDALAGLRQRHGAGFDLVFLDPPFAEGANEALLTAALQAARATLSATGLIYLEAPHAWSDEALAPLGLALHRHGKAGAVAFHLLRALTAD